MTLLVSASQAFATTPEPLDAEFLDYLVACEDEAGDWTVIADEKPREKVTEPATEKPAPPPGKQAVAEKVGS